MSQRAGALSNVTQLRNGGAQLCPTPHLGLVNAPPRYPVGRRILLRLGLGFDKATFSYLICTVSNSTECSQPSASTILTIIQEGGRGMTPLASEVGRVHPPRWVLCLPGMTQAIPLRPRLCPGPHPCILPPFMPTSHVLSLGRSQVLQTQPCFSTKFLCAAGSASRVVRSLETSRQLEAHFPELCRSLREARGPSSSAGMSASWSLCFWRVLITFNNKEGNCFLLPS